MATWQFDMYLLPRAKLMERFGGMPEYLGPDLFNSIGWGEGHQTRSNLAQFINPFVSPCPSWSVDIQMWGDEDGNRIDVVYEGEALKEIFIRVDAREQSNTFLKGIVELAHFCDALFWIMEKDKIIEPNVDTLTFELKRSDAYRYVQNPVEFLKSIARDKD